MFQMVNADKNVLKYIDGFAVHWYWDFMIGVGVINKIHNKHPDKFILYTEACLGKKIQSLFFQAKPKLVIQ